MEVFHANNAGNTLPDVRGEKIELKKPNIACILDTIHMVKSCSGLQKDAPLYAVAFVLCPGLQTDLDEPCLSPNKPNDMFFFSNKGLRGSKEPRI